MKKGIMILVTLIALASIRSEIRAQAFYQGQVTVSAGYGFPNFTRTLFNIADGVSNLESHVIGPVYGKFEYAVTDVVGFGVNVAYTYGNATYQTSDDGLDSVVYDTDFTYQSYSVLGRLNFHFEASEMFDPYAGIGLGYRNAKYSYDSDDPNTEASDIHGLIHFGVDLTLGARVYLTENFGLYGEVGLAKTPLQVGLVAKF
jgi:opacity protein-like surface antigen